MASVFKSSGPETPGQVLPSRPQIAKGSILPSPSAMSIPLSEAPSKASLTLPVVGSLGHAQSIFTDVAKPVLIICGQCGGFVSA